MTGSDSLRRASIQRGRAVRSWGGCSEVGPASGRQHPEAEGHESVRRAMQRCVEVGIARVELCRDE